MLAVMKFGGSSVADLEKIRNVAERCIKKWKEGNQVIVVLSAMGKTTDGLIGQAHQIADMPSRREMDMLLSTGEQLSLIHISERECWSSSGGMTGALLMTTPLLW